DFIPVHIFPVRFSNPKSMQYLDKAIKADEESVTFTNSLKKVYDYFEEYKKLPLISINKSGQYIVL
ncbi:MAG: L,D-transpeptidase family protein, partial [Ilyomonas sp.]